MIEYLKLLSIYNQNANNSVLSIFRNLSQDELSKNRGSFVKSLFGLIDHIVEAEIYFLKPLEKTYSQFDFLQHRFSKLNLKYNEINFPSLEELAECITTCDLCYITFIESIDPNLLNNQISFDSFQGKKQWSIAFLLLQVINHSTHHRGQISQILDEIGIKHHYSSIPELPILK